MCVLSGNKPVQCTCGHTVSSGFVCEETITVMYHGKPKTIIYTYCSEECAATTMREALDSYVDLEETQISLYLYFYPCALVSFTVWVSKRPATPRDGS